MNFNLEIESSDFEFIKAAIKLRTHAILEDLDMQVASQVAASIAPAGPCSFEAAPVKAEGQPVSFTVNVDQKKKPHWTQTPRGKKIMAARKRKGTK